MRKIAFLFLVLAVSVFGLFACDSTENTAAVESISVVEGYKTVYTVGDDLDLSSLKITVTYSDETTKEVAVTSSMISGADMDSVGPQTVTVTYNGKTATFNITVNPKQEEVTLSSISVKGNYKAEYNVGDNLDLTGMILVLTYSDQTTEELAVTETMLGSVDMSTAGVKPITVSYEGKTTIFYINVEEHEIVKVNPTVEFSIEAGDELTIGVDGEPTVTVTPGNLTYTVHYEKDETVVASSFAEITEAGTYALVVNVNGNEQYNDYKVWVVFKAVKQSNKVNPEISVSINNGSTLYIGVDSAPTVTVTPGDLQYEVFYTKDDGATNLGTEFPSEPGIYAINVKVFETDEYNYVSTFRWFNLEAPASQETILVTLKTSAAADGVLSFAGFVDANGEEVTVDSSLYSIWYEESETKVLPENFVAGHTYVLIVRFEDGANYQYILNDDHIGNAHKAWPWFIYAPVAPSNRVMVDAVFNEVEGGVEFAGFVDAEGNPVTIDSSLYTVYYEADGTNLGSTLPTEPGDYALIVEFVEDADYEFITKSHPNATQKVWQGFKVADSTDETPTEKDVIMVDAVFIKVDGGVEFDGFIDAEENYVTVDSSLYTFYYESNGTNLGSTLPTQPGDYALVVEFVEGANYEFITKSHPNATQKVWQGFKIEASSGEKIMVSLKTYRNEDNVIMFDGFIDEDGNLVTVDSSLYTVRYEKNETEVLPENFVSGETYSLVVRFVDGANYEYIQNDDHVGNAHKAWPWFVYTPMA